MIKMERKKSSTLWTSSQTGIKRRRREDLVVRVFKPGMQLQQILSKAERGKKDDNELLKNNDVDGGARFSPSSGSPRSLVSTPVEMYRKFWHGGSVASQMTTNAREAEGKEKSGSSSATTSPRSFHSRWRISRTFAGNRSPGEKGTDVGQRKRNSSEKKDKTRMHNEQQHQERQQLKGNDDQNDHISGSKTTKTLKRSDSVITVVPALSDIQNKAIPPPSPPISKPPEYYPQRPIYIHGPIRLQEGVLSQFSTRKDSIASLEAFLTTAAIEPPNPVQESRRASDDAAENDIVEFFDSYGFGLGTRQDYRLDQFWEEEEEEERVHQFHNEDNIDYEVEKVDGDDDDGDTICYCNSNSDTDSEILSLGNSGNIFMIGEKGASDYDDNDNEKDGSCGNGNGNDDDSDETADVELFYEPATESESQIIEITLAQPQLDETVGVAVTC